MFFTRADSYSVVNDYVWCAARMAPELQQTFKDEARKAFKAVKGDPTLERLANLWTLHSQA